MARMGRVTAMGYSLLGKLVWRLGRRYLRRRFPGLGRKLAVAGAGAVVLSAGAALSARRRPATGA